MEKLTAILAVVPPTATGEAPVLAKANALARIFAARLEVMQAGAMSAEALELAILDRIRVERHDLVIKAPAGPHPLKRLTLEANDWRLARECPAPLLLARGRAWAQPMRIAAALDVANAEELGLARTIMHTAGFLALGCNAELAVLYSEREERDETLRMERAVRLSQVVREFHVGLERLRLYNGAPERSLSAALEKGEFDLLALGSRRESSLGGGLVPGVTGALADATPGDILFVKDTEPLRSRAGDPLVTRRAAL